MFLGVLSHESDKFGVIISPLIGLMDEQVCFIEYFSTAHQFKFTCKVGKLSSVGVRATRAKMSDTDMYSGVLSGDYRFGISIDV